MFLSILVLCSAGIIRADQEIHLTVLPNKDLFGRAVIVKAEPPSNYRALLYGPYITLEPKFNTIYFNESGFWDNPGNIGSMQPYTRYNLTINVTETRQSSIEFITDVSVPIGGVELVFTEIGTNFVEVSLEPRLPRFVYGPPTGYHVDACVAPERRSCKSYVCLESPCTLDSLLPNMNYTVNASIFNIDSFNRTLERRDYVILYDVTTKEDPSVNSSYPWIVVGGSLLGLCGFSGIVFAGCQFSRKLSKERPRVSIAPTSETELKMYSHTQTSPNAIKKAIVETIFSR